MFRREGLYVIFVVAFLFTLYSCNGEGVGDIGDIPPTEYYVSVEAVTFGRAWDPDWEVIEQPTDTFTTMDTVVVYLVSCKLSNATFVRSKMRWYIGDSLIMATSSVPGKNVGYSGDMDSLTHLLGELRKCDWSPLPPGSYKFELVFETADDSKVVAVLDSGVVNGFIVVDENAVDK